MLSSKREDAAESDRKVDYAAMGRAETILDLNGLKYRIPQKLSSAVSRSYKKEFSIKGNHAPGDVITFDLNTGSNYVDPESAMLSFRFQMTCPAQDAAQSYKWSGNMGGAAVIQEIRIISKNGVELDRVQDAGLLATIWSNYNLSPESKSMIGMVDGYGAVAVSANGATSLTTPLEVSIPLKYICGFFRPVIQGMLIPAGLASGLRMEISLTTAGVPLIGGLVGAKVPTTFNVYDAELLLQTTQLNDSTASALLSESSSNGIEYTFPSYYSTKLNIAANATFSNQVNKAVSQGVRAFLVLQDTAAAVNEDKLASQVMSNLTSYQYRVGQQYYPNQVVNRVSQYYTYAQDGMLGLRKVEQQPNQITYNEYTKSFGKGVIATSLETSARLNLSGLMLNNSSVLAIEGSIGAAAAKATLFLEFVAVARTALNRTQLKI